MDLIKYINIYFISVVIIYKHNEPSKDIGKYPKMNRATLRWITNPLLRSNQVLLELVNGLQSEPEAFVTPYTVETPGEAPITVHTKYVFSKGELTEYFYEVEAEQSTLEMLCARARTVSFPPLKLTYLLPDPEKGISEEDLAGVLSILQVMIRKVWLGDAVDKMSGTQIEKVLYERYKNPAYITFQPLQKQLLHEDYDILKEYRAKLSNPLGTLQKDFYYAPPNQGTHSLSPIHVSEDVLADVRSKIDIKTLLGYTLLHPTSMPYHILEEWSIAHEYNKDTILHHLKRVGPDHQITLIDNKLVYKNPDSIFWDLKSRSEVKEDHGWFVFRVPEVVLSEDALGVYSEIAETFHFQRQKRVDVHKEVLFQPPVEWRSAFGFDVEQWLEEARQSVYTGTPIHVRISGTWIYLDKMSLTSESMAKVTYAAYRGFAKVLQQNGSLDSFTNELVVYPDFSVSVPVYTLEEFKLVQEEMEGILEVPESIQVVMCKTVEECVASRAKTKERIPNSLPFSISIQGHPILASNSKLELVEPDKVQKDEADGDKIPLGDVDPSSPAVQGFFDLGTVKGNIQRADVRIDVKKGSIHIVEFEGRLYASVVLSTSKIADLISFPIPTKGKMQTFINKMERYVETLWKQGWFLTEWGKNQYKTKKTLSAHLLRDVQHEISSFDNLEKIYSTFSTTAQRA
uniref:Uncharacterized protein n=1 Tax=Pithovirus LCPAC304 TaxID=2506594 RepID=A0A481Z7J3_9VIRU|nr:MAG: hypothetical protein LCPAC304_02020 [Pithovirus LCPAC304]